VPLCRVHHDEVTKIHNGPFEERYGVSFSAAIQGLNEEYRLTKGGRVDVDSQYQPVSAR
jgi:hypothetical protein